MLCCLGFCSILFPKVYKMFLATGQKFLLKASKTTAHTFFFRSRLRLRTSFWECAPDALVFNFRF